MPTWLLAFALLLLPKIANAGDHSGDGAFWFIIALFLIGVFFFFGFALVLAFNIMGIVRKKPSLIMGSIALIMGALDVLGSFGLIGHGEQGLQSTLAGLLIGGVFCYVGYRNIDMAQKQRAQAETTKES